MEAISVGPWGCEEGAPFCHQINNGRIKKLTLLYEGGFKSLIINSFTETPDSTKNLQPASVIRPQIKPVNIINDSDYRQALGTHWRKRFDDCTVEVISGSTRNHNENYVIVSKRNGSYNSIEQEITGEVCEGGVYVAFAKVSVKGGNGQEFEMRATIKIEDMQERSSFQEVGSVFVRNRRWKKLECWFQINTVPKNAFFYIAGPPQDVDLCIGPVSILPVTRQFVVNLDPDEYFNGITGYFRKIQNGKPEVISSLTFLTNRTKYGPYGPEKGTFFSFKTSNGEIIGFYGTSVSYFNSIGCHIKPCGSPMPDVSA